MYNQNFLFFQTTGKNSACELDSGATSHMIKDGFLIIGIDKEHTGTKIDENGNKFQLKDGA